VNGGESKAARTSSASAGSRDSLAIFSATQWVRGPRPKPPYGYPCGRRRTRDRPQGLRRATLIVEVGRGAGSTEPVGEALRPSGSYKDGPIMSLISQISWTTWSSVSSGLREIELRGDRLESVGHLAPFLAPGQFPSQALSGDDGDMPEFLSASRTPRFCKACCQVKIVRVLHRSSKRSPRSCLFFGVGAEDDDS
jgi:hypothetical protein